MMMTTHRQPLTDATAANDRWLLSGGAWIAIALASSLSSIIWIAGLGRSAVPAWDPPARLAGLVGLVALTWGWPRLRPLRRFLWTVLAFSAGMIAKDTVTAQSAVAGWLQTLAPAQARLADTMLWIIFPVTLMILSLIGSGMSRQDLFLIPGALRARGKLLIPWIPAVSWVWLAFVLMALVLGPLLMQLSALIRLDTQLAGRLLTALPVIVAVALLRSLQEDLRFRVIFLGQLAPLIGARQALLLSSLLFGLVYWLGSAPGNGVGGALAAGIGGWILGASILETRGVGWIWIIHALTELLAAIILVA